MKLPKVHLAFSACALVVSVGCLAAPIKVLNFEGVNNASIGSTLPSNYGGFSWGAYKEDSYTSIFRFDPPTSMPDAASSGEWFLFIGSGGQPLVAANSATPFDLVSVFLTGTVAQRDSVRIEGFKKVNGRVPAFSMTITPSDTPTKYDIDFHNIRRVLFTPIAGGRNEHRIGLDDFAFSGNPRAVALPNEIPEPSGLALIMIALCGLVGWSKLGPARPHAARR